MTLGVAAAPASAGTPVVNQYTETMPGPGGEVLNPPKPGRNGKSKDASDGQGGKGGNASGSDSDEFGVAGSKGDSGKPGGRGNAAHNYQGNGPGWDLVNNTDPGTNASGTVPASIEVADGGTGLGWVFPAMLVAVAAAALGFSLGRRRRGSAQGTH